MGGEHSFYPGGQYPLDSDSTMVPEYSVGMSYQFPAAQFGPTTDARTSNQIKAVFDKISTGAKVIEVTAIQTESLDYIPKQHFDEIKRLKDLAGVDLTFHGPLVEATGITKQGWDDTQRQQAERQIWNAVERGHQLDPQGNVVITFHAGVSGIQPETKVYDPKEKKEKFMGIMFVDEHTGNFGNLPLTEKRYFPGEELKPEEDEKKRVLAELERKNKEEWNRKLQHLNFQAYQGKTVVDKALRPQEDDEGTPAQRPEQLLHYYEGFETKEVQEELRHLSPEDYKRVNNKIQEIAHGEIYVRDAYAELKKLYNEAYSAAERNSLSTDENKREEAKKHLDVLNNYKGEMKEIVKEIESPKKVDVLAQEIIKGVNVLRTIGTPESLRPLKDFMMDKASDTFSNVAFQAYERFKDNAPIISLENSPAGTTAFDRAEDLRDLIEATQRKFEKKAMEEFGMSQEEAKRQAEKLIGATWDVGHINMIRKSGYTKEHTIEEAKKIASHVKHVHLSDNFGLEHTELPMGMGNVATKEILALHENFKKAKKIIETGGWYKDFKITPLRETLSAFGSPLYASQMAPAWSQAGFASSGYFSGYGFNPDIHHSLYGAGFSGLPVELGGQIQGRSRLSGTPME